MIFSVTQVMIVTDSSCAIKENTAIEDELQPPCTAQTMVIINDLLIWPKKEFLYLGQPDPT